MPCVFDIISAKFCTFVYADWKESFASIGGKTVEDKSKAIFSFYSTKEPNSSGVTMEFMTYWGTVKHDFPSSL